MACYEKINNISFKYKKLKLVNNYLIKCYVKQNVLVVEQFIYLRLNSQRVSLDII